MRTITTNLKYLFLGLAVFFALGLAHAASYTAPTDAAPASNVAVPLHTGPSQVKDGSLSVGTFAAYQDANFSQQLVLNGTVFGGQPGSASSTLNIGLAGYPTNISANGGVAVAGAIKTASVPSATLCADTTGMIVACTVKHLPPPTQGVTVSLVDSDGPGTMGMMAQLSAPVSVDVTVQTTATYDTSMNTTLLDKLAASFTAEAKVVAPVGGDGCPVPMTGESVTLTIPANSTNSQQWSIPSGSCSGAIKATIDSVDPSSDGSTSITATGGTLVLN